MLIHYSSNWAIRSRQLEYVIFQNIWYEISLHICKYRLNITKSLPRRRAITPQLQTILKRSGSRELQNKLVNCSTLLTPDNHLNTDLPKVTGFFLCQYIVHYCSELVTRSLPGWEWCSALSFCNYCLLTVHVLIHDCDTAFRFPRSCYARSHSCSTALFLTCKQCLACLRWYVCQSRSLPWQWRERWLSGGGANIHIFTHALLVSFEIDHGLLAWWINKYFPKLLLSPLNDPPRPLKMAFPVSTGVPLQHV